MKKVTQRGVIVLLCILLGSVNSLTARAIDLQFYSGNDISFSNPDAGGCEVSQVEAGPVEVVEGENIETFLRFFTAKGFSLATAAGMAGNIKQESSFNPAVIQGGAIADDDYIPEDSVGFGIAQWSFGGRGAAGTPPYNDRQGALIAFAKSKGVKITDLTMQLEFIWQEMQASSLQDMMTKLAGEKTDPVRAAIIFHGLTTNIEREGEGINPIFKAAGAGYGFERSGDTSDEVVDNRGGAAKGYYDLYKTKIEDGSGVVGGSTPTTTTQSTCKDSETDVSSDLGVGKGSFTDSGEVKDWANVLHNAQESNRVYSDSLVGDGICAAIVSRVWRGQNIGYGYPPVGYAIDLWYAEKTKHGHTDRSPKKGAILLYETGKRAGHVVIYLGDNKILNDGFIVDADFVESDWGAEYVGWVDPNDLGWTSIKAGDIKSAVGQ